MISHSRVTLGVSLLLSLVVQSMAQAKVICSSESAAVTYPSANDAIRKWSKDNSVGMPENLRSTTLLEFCTAAEGLSAEKGLSSAELDQKAVSTITEYLDRLSDPDKKARSVSAILRSAFGAAGFSRPLQKIYGVVRITYVHTVDSLQIGSETMAPWPAILVSVGHSQLVGRLKVSEICRVDLNIDAIGDTNISC